MLIRLFGLKYKLLFTFLMEDTHIFLLEENGFGLPV